MKDKQQDDKHKGGRPLLFESVEALQKAIEAYFADCAPHPEETVVWKWHKKNEKYYDHKARRNKTREVDDLSKAPIEEKTWHITNGKPISITSLANYLGTSRQTLINYQDRDEFFDTIKAAKDRCEEYWEHQLLGSHAAGPIFNLKNNFDWRDRQEIDHTTKDKPIPLLAGVAPDGLVVEDDDGGSAQADNSADEDQQS